MPIPDGMRQVNKVALNKVTRLLAPWLPGLGGKNVLAAGGCELLTRGRHIELDSPRLFQDETRQEIRVVERKILGLLHVDDFLELRVVPDVSR